MGEGSVGRDDVVKLRVHVPGAVYEALECCVGDAVRNRTDGQYPHGRGRIRFLGESQPDELEVVCGVILLQMPSPSRSRVD